jgi:hypothetical protein
MWVLLCSCRRVDSGGLLPAWLIIRQAGTHCHDQDCRLEGTRPCGSRSSCADTRRCGSERLFTPKKSSGLRDAMKNLKQLRYPIGRFPRQTTSRQAPVIIDREVVGTGASSWRTEWALIRHASTHQIKSSRRGGCRSLASSSSILWRASDGAPMSRELRFRGEPYGWKAQFFDRGELLVNRGGFSLRALAVLWAEGARKTLESDGGA